MPLSAREALWLTAIDENGQVLCNLCGGQVHCGDAWEESHFPIPKALDGTKTGIAHRKCNRDHGAKAVTPAVAKVKRIRRKHLGISGKSLGSRPMPGGKRSDKSKTFSGEVISRQNQAEKHRALMAKRFGENT